MLERLGLKGKRMELAYVVVSVVKIIRADLIMIMFLDYQKTKRCTDYFSVYHWYDSKTEIVREPTFCGAFWDGRYAGLFANDDDRASASIPECDGSRLSKN